MKKDNINNHYENSLIFQAAFRFSVAPVGFGWLVALGFGCIYALCFMVLVWFITLLSFSRLASCSLL